MNTFTASNGMSVERRANEDVVIDGYTTFMSDGTALALREFFRAEEDTRFGRWRYDSTTVVYADGDRAVVLDERRPHLSNEFDRRHFISPEPVVSTRLRLAARAYFDAHPEPKPAWHDAQPGEVWALKIAGSEEIAMRAVDAGHTRFWPIDGPEDAMTYGARSHAITAGRRIWPEVAS